MSVLSKEEVTISKSEIKGFTSEEVAEIRKQKLVEDYQFCKSKMAEARRHEEEIKSIYKAYNKLIIEYRINSVDRVLDYIRHKRITDESELDILLCHCQNKLRGNIDGTEIDLTESEEQ